MKYPFIETGLAELCREIEKLPASEQQTKVSLLASDLRKMADYRAEVKTAAEKLYTCAVELINDWKKGDFDLPTLARHDAHSLADAADAYQRAKDFSSPRTYYRVTAANGDECVFETMEQATAATLALGECDGDAVLKCFRMTPTEYTALPATSGSARISKLASQ
jgi:hypothetical protein